MTGAQAKCGRCGQDDHPDRVEQVDRYTCLRTVQLDRPQAQGQKFRWTGRDDEPSAMRGHHS